MLSSIPSFLFPPSFKKNGPLDSESLNKSIETSMIILTSFLDQWNKVVLPLLGSLPGAQNSNPTVDASTNPNPFAFAFDGANIYLDTYANETSNYGKFFSTGLNRPLTIKESLLDVYNDLSGQINNLSTIVQSTGLEGLSDTEKEAIGMSIFDDLEVDDPSSLKAKVSGLENKLTQFAADVWNNDYLANGANTYPFTGTGNRSKAPGKTINERLNALNTRVYGCLVKEEEAEGNTTYTLLKWERVLAKQTGGFPGGTVSKFNVTNIDKKATPIGADTLQSSPYFTNPAFKEEISSDGLDPEDLTHGQFAVVYGDEVNPPAGSSIGDVYIKPNSTVASLGYFYYLSALEEWIPGSEKLYLRTVDAFALDEYGAPLGNEYGSYKKAELQCFDNQNLKFWSYGLNSDFTKATSIELSNHLSSVVGTDAGGALLEPITLVLDVSVSA